MLAGNACDAVKRLSHKWTDDQCLGSLSMQEATAAMVIVLEAVEALQAELRLVCCSLSMCPAIYACKGGSQGALR